MLFLMSSFYGVSQIALTENFDGGVLLPAGWSGDHTVAFVQTCDGFSVRDQLNASDTTGNLTSPNQISASNGTDVTVSFDYKIVDWAAAVDPTAPGWGELLVEYSTNDGADWTTAATINDSNHTTSAACANFSTTIAAADVPDGSGFRLRFTTNWAAGDYYVYIDNISATQVVDNAPSCSTLFVPTNGAIGVDIESNLSWSDATGVVSSYTLSVGTTSGGTDIVNNQNVGLSTTFDLPTLQYSTQYFVTITPSNAAGDAQNCEEFSFTTGADPNMPVDCATGVPVNTVYCYESLTTDTFSFTSSDGAPLFLQFNEGQIQAGPDTITIYDGTDNTGTVLFNGDNGGDFTGLSVTANSGNIFITIQTDGFTSCASGLTPWNFDVFCVDDTIPPNCDANLINPANGDVAVNEGTAINWTPASIVVTGYTITVGSTPGGTDIADNIDVGNVTTWQPPADLAFLTTYYVTVVPYNDNGNATGCNEQSFTTREDPNAPVDCASGQPRNTTYCYDNNDNTSFSFISSDGSPLMVVFNSGTTENNWDEVLVLDSDGTTDLNAGSPYGNGGNLTGLTYVSTGDSITVQIQSDGSVSCGSGSQTPWDFDVFCVDTTALPNCNAALTVPANEAEGVEIETDLTWSPATVLVTGYTLTVGTTPGGTDILDNQDVGNVTTFDLPADLPYETTIYVTIIPYNANGTPDTGDCTEYSFTTESDPNQILDCSAGDTVTTEYCYTNNDNTEFSFTSNDGSQIVIVFNSGNTENNWDELVITDSDGSNMYTGYGNGGDLTGLVFVSTGDSIVVGVTSDGSVVSCTNSPWNFTASCFDPTAVPNCNASLTAPVNEEIDVEINTDISWSPASIFVTGYTVTVGSTPGGNDIADNVDVGDVTTWTIPTTLEYETTYYVTIIPYNDNGPANMGCTEESFTTKPDPNTIIDCDEGPIVISYCYENNDTNVFSYTSVNGDPVTITFLEGQVQNNLDELVILDSDGTTDLNAATPYGNAGDVSGLQYTSTGNSLSVQVQSNGFGSCASSNYTPLNYEVKCQTCVVQTVDYTVVPGDCETTSDFTIDVNITDMGDASSITVSDNQGSDSQEVTGTGIVTFGPYPAVFESQVVITVANTNDINCVINSEALNYICPLPQAQCPIINAGEDVEATCEDAEVELEANFMVFGQDTTTYELNSLECPTPPAEGGTPTSLFIDDAWTDPINLTFNFCFFGEVYDRVQIGANGALRFELDPTDVGGGSNAWNLDTDNSIPNNTNPTLAEGNIFGVVHDIDPSVCGDLNYIIAGTAPARQFIVNFTEICHFSNACNDLKSTTQIILYESSNAIDINVFEKPICPTWNDGLAGIGIQNNDGTIGFTPPGRDIGVWEATNEFWRFSPSQGDANYTFEWQNEAGDVLSNDPNYTVIPTSGSTTYTAVVNYDRCDGTSATITDDVVVTLTGTGDASFTMTPDCTSATAQVTGSVGGTFSFNPAPTDTALIDSTTGEITNGTGGTTYTVQYEVTGVCAATATQTVTLLPPDDSSFTLAPTCDGATATITGATGGTFAFNPAPTDGASIDTTTGAITGGTQGTAYTVEYTTAGDCPTTTSQTVTVFVVEDASFTLTATCDNGLVVNVTGDAGGTFAFNPAPTDDATIDATTGVIANTTQGETYTVEYTTGGPCPVSTTQTATALMLDVAAFTYTANCSGATATITDTMGGTFAFSPAVTDNANLDANTGEITNATPGETYTVQYSTAGVCPDEVVVSVTVPITPMSSFATNVVYEVCPNATVPIQITAMADNYDVEDVSIVWYDDTETVISGETGLTLPVLTSGTYTIQVTSAEGCSSMESVYVSELETCVIPQGISPNNDGLNDTFDLSSYSVQSLEIFNRNGTKVYSQVNYTDQWRGQSDDGSDLPVGTYFYVMKYQGNKVRTAWVYINREN